jgi:diguanylate cyclase (GGDEF)-like protein/PAS domain S-box-containing protein
MDHHQVRGDLVDALNCGIVLLDENGRVILWNDWMAERSAIPATRALGAALSELFPGLAGGRIDIAVGAALRSGLSTILSHNLHPRPFPLFVRRPGAAVPVEQSVVVRPLRQGKPAVATTGVSRVLPTAMALVQVSDVTAAVTRENRLREMADYARRLIEASIDPFITIDTGGIITDANAAAEHVTGLARRVLIGSAFIDHFAHDEAVATSVKAALAEGEARDLPLMMRHVDGSTTDLLFNISVYRTRSGEVAGILAAGRDVTRQKEIERELARLATTDTLTGVANRRHFMDLAEREVMRTQRYHHPMALLSVDVDHFKMVNDTYGHAVGDEALRRLVDMCQGVLRETDTLGRIGGEEFMILLPETDLKDTLAIAERLRQAVEGEPVTHSGHVFRMTVSIGAARLMPGESLARLLFRADVALYQAKRTGRNRVCTAPTPDDL